MNLCSTFRLTAAQRQILERGLTFIPTPTQTDVTVLRRDLHMYHRRLKILEHFQFSTSYVAEPFCEPSRWEPKHESVSADLRRLIEGDRIVLEGFRFRAEQNHNITLEQRKALSTLAKDTHIIIKPADKGGQIVLQDKAHYLQEALRQLYNTTYYRPLAHSMQPETQGLVRQLVSGLYSKGYISKKQRLYLFGPDEPRHRQFYLLPKIHKPPESWSTAHVIPPGRPIVSDCGSESHRIAEYVDYYINPLSHSHPSYVKDTYSFVNSLRTLSFPPNSFLFTVDVDSLYTNIDTELGLQAVSHHFSRHPDPDRPDREILDLLRLTLTRNDFVFNDKHFLQISGCAMGRKYSPAYADIYLAQWEESAFRKCSKTPAVYLRYLDDLFGVFTGSEAEFMVFFDTLNNHHPKIKLKHNLQRKEVEFLDTVVFFAERQSITDPLTLATKVYFKETDRHALLHKTSFHPKHTFGGVIKSQLIRFQRICTYPHHTEEATRVLFSALLPRGYSRRFLRTIKAEVRNLFAQNAGEYVGRETQDKPIIPLILTYSDNSMRFRKDIGRNFQHLVTKCPELGDFRLITALRRNKNLQDVLVHAKLRTDTRGPGETDPSPLSLPFLFNPRTGLGFPLPQKFTRYTCNVIYTLICNQCKSLYVGETSGALVIRIKQHTYHMHKHDLSTVLYDHFQGSTCKDFSFAGVESNASWTQGQRRRNERIWINKLKTYSPWGLNNAAEAFETSSDTEVA